MKPVLLLLTAVATIGAAPSPPARSAGPAPRYEAGGFEPFWSLVVEHGWLTYDPGQAGVRPTRTRQPRRQPTRNGYRYVVSRQLTIDVRHARCVSYPGRIFADTVYVTGVEEGGCGGRPIAPATLTATIWSARAVNGARYGHGESNFLFAYDGVVRGSTGCSDFSVPFTERRPWVRFGRMTVTRRGCAGLGIERERRVLEVFSGRSRIGFVDGDTLILTGRHGTARLQPD
jgi:heat shock protein HslJ